MVAELDATLPETMEIGHELMEKFSGVDVGLVYCALGKTKEAMKWFQKGYADRARGMDILGVDPVFDACRTDPAFLALLQQMKLP